MEIYEIGQPRFGFTGEKSTPHKRNGSPRLQNLSTTTILAGYWGSQHITTEMSTFELIQMCLFLFNHLYG